MTKKEAIKQIKEKGYVRFEDDIKLAKELEKEGYVVTVMGKTFQAEEQEY